MAGHRPSWVADTVGHLPVVQGPNKYRNSTANLLAACTSPDVTDRFWLFNDDFFVTHPVDRVPILHRGPVLEHLPWIAGHYRKGAAATAALLATWGHPDPLSYELHVPMLVDGPVMADLLVRATDAGLDNIHQRTLYGTIAGLGGLRVADCKVHQPTHRTWDSRRPWVSTNDRSFTGHVGDWIHSLFPAPCEHER